MVALGRLWQGSHARVLTDAQSPDAPTRQPVLRAWLPFETPWARVAFFAFGVFGHCWTWFHLFIPVIEFAGILRLGLLVGLLGALGVLAGALACERLARVEWAANHPA